MAKLPSHDPSVATAQESRRQVPPAAPPCSSAPCPAAHEDQASLPVEPDVLDAPPFLPPPLGEVHGEVCSRCGGSGRLRINDDSFRTCLDCLGQGVRSRMAPSAQLADWMVPRALGRL